jgi:outer membrane protein insertion porin family
LPKDSGLRGAVFFDSGSVWDYKGETSNPATGEINGFINGTGGTYFCGNCALQFADTAAVRASVGASLIWDSPFGPLRFDFAYPLLKQSYDRLQWFQFGGGARF